MMTKNFRHATGAVYDGGMSIALLVVAAAVVVPHVRSALSFAPAPGLPPEVARAAAAEAAGIWAPHGVEIVVVDPGRLLPADTVVLRVAVGTAPPGSSIALGEIGFDVDGMPGHLVTVFVDRVLRLLAEARVSGVPMAAWPPSFQRRVLARAIGRVIAHEIGHFVLRIRGHSRSGLMRVSLTAGDLADPGRLPFQLRN
jgi:hypothetical protein